MFDYILFDLDGTLTESGQGIMNGCEYALHKMGIEEHDPQRLNLFVGPPFINSCMDRYGMSPEEADRALVHYRDYYTKTGIYENAVYEGVEEMLRILKDRGKHLAVATAKPHDFCMTVLEYFHLTPWFEVVGAVDLEAGRRSKAQVIAWTLEQLGVTDKSRAVMVGDRSYDVLGASENGIRTIGALYGYGSRPELQEAGAAFLAEHPLEIPGLL